MMNKIIFKIKSNWFDKGNIKDLNVEKFWVYLNLRKYLLKYMDNKCIFNIDELYKEIQRYYKKHNKKYSKPNIKKYIFELRQMQFINFERKYNMKNNIDLVVCDLLDLPQLDDKHKPISEQDYFISIDYEMIDNIFNAGLNENHVIIYYLLKKYINANQITISYESMSEILNLDKDSINKYSFELEKYEFIANKYTKLQNGHTGNNFLVSTDKTYKKDNEIKETSQKNNIRRLKKRLQNNKISVTQKAIDQKKEYLQYMTKEEKEIFDIKNQIHIVYGIEYLYFELLDKLQERKANEHEIIYDISDYEEIEDIEINEEYYNNPLEIFEKQINKKPIFCSICGVNYVKPGNTLCDKCDQIVNKNKKQV